MFLKSILISLCVLIPGVCFGVSTCIVNEDYSNLRVCLAYVEVVMPLGSYYECKNCGDMAGKQGNIVDSPLLKAGTVFYLCTYREVRPILPGKRNTSIDGGKTYTVSGNNYSIRVEGGGDQPGVAVCTDMISFNKCLKRSWGKNQCG